MYDVCSQGFPQIMLTTVDSRLIWPKDKTIDGLIEKASFYEIPRNYHHLAQLFGHMTQSFVLIIDSYG